MFEIVKRDGLARLGIFETKSGIIETPNLLPVVNPKINTVAPRELYDTFGFKAIITNSYIIKNNNQLKERAQTEGLHKMLDFPGIIMTDSGTFQSHMYGKLDVTNSEMIEFQKSIGTDIGTVLDIFTEPFWSKEQTAESIVTTLERTQHACDTKGGMLINGVVQGSVYCDLREYCAKKMASMNIDVHPIGGAVPLMEQYRYTELVDIIISSKKGLNPSRPVHLFGAGHPMILAFATLLGCDLFDSSSYAKFARDNRMMFIDGTYRLTDMQSLDCNCPACRGQTLTSLKAMNKKEREGIIARHNLYQISNEISLIRRYIREGRIWDLAEMRCRAHPELLNALRRLKEHKEYLEITEPVSRDGALFYTGSETRGRPAFERYKNRLMTRYIPSTDKAAIFPDSSKPYGRHYMSDFNIVRSAGYTPIVLSSFGPVPAELDEVYPISQSLFPDISDKETEYETKEFTDVFLKKMGFVDIKKFEDIESGEIRYDANLLRGKAVARYQFGFEVADILFKGKIEFVVSKKTGKIRNVISDGEHILSMRADDGLYTLRAEGAKRIIESLHSLKMRAIITDDAVPFVSNGRNVFCQFVTDMDAELRPMDEVIVVDKNDTFIATGRVQLISDEVKSFKKGIAIKVRSGNGES